MVDTDVVLPLLREATGSEVKVWWALACRVDENGHASASVAEVAERVRVSIRTARRTLRNLEQRGAIVLIDSDKGEITYKLDAWRGGLCEVKS